MGRTAGNGMGDGHVGVWRGEGLVVERYRYAPGPRMALAAHLHDDYQLCLSADEDGAYRCRGAVQAAPRGTLSVIHPGEVHATLAPARRHAPAGYDVLYLSPQLLASRSSRRQGDAAPFFGPAPLGGAALLGACATLLASCREGEPALAREAALDAFAARLLAAGGLPRVPLPRRRLSEATLCRVRDLLHGHHARDLRGEELAEVAACSADHLRQSFRLRFGLPPHAYLLAVRVESARRLLAEGVSPAAAAVRVGFYDQSHLCRHFKRLVGVTPGRYAVRPGNVLYGDGAAPAA